MSDASSEAGHVQGLLKYLFLHGMVSPTMKTQVNALLILLSNARQEHGIVCIYHKYEHRNIIYT
jgi:hypothetical protein